MSNAALTWAFQQPIKPATRKFVLVALADAANHENEAFPSGKALEMMTGLDKKTIYKALDELEKEGFLVDTGKRKGPTQSVRVYKLSTEAYPNSGTLEAYPKTDESLPVFPHKLTRFSPEAYPKTGKGTPRNPNGTQREPSGDSSPSPTKEFSDGWCKAFEEKFGTKYRFNGGRDGKALKELLATKIPVPELLEVAKTAWGMDDLGGFLSDQVSHIAGFNSVFNQIQVRVAKEQQRMNRLYA